VAVPFVLINIGEQSVSSAPAGILVAATSLFVVIWPSPTVLAALGDSSSPVPGSPFWPTTPWSPPPAPRKPP
jgi:hypothetical protein